MRARDKILANLEVIYRESFDRAKEATDQRRMAISTTPTCGIS
jgi:hypothetical protein